MLVLKVKIISLPYIFQVLYVLCFTRSRYQVSVYRTIGPQVVDGVSIQIVHVFDCQGGAGSPSLNDICQR